MKGFRSRAILVVICLALVAGLAYVISNVTAGGPGTKTTHTGAEQIKIASPTYGYQYDEAVFTPKAPLQTDRAVPAQLAITTFELDSSGHVTGQHTRSGLAEITRLGPGKVRIYDSSEASTSKLTFQGQTVRVEGELDNIGCQNWRPLAAGNQTVLARNISCNP